MNDGSIVRVGWYLVLTTQDADSGPLSGVAIEIFDETDMKIIEDSTGSDGKVNLFLWEKTVYSEGADYIGDYLLKINRDGTEDELTLKPSKSNAEIFFIYKGGVAGPSIGIFSQGYTSIIIIVVLVGIIIVLLLTRRRSS